MSDELDINPDALLEGDFIKAVDLGTKLPANPTYTIAHVQIETLPNLKKPGTDKDKGVIYFEELKRGWVMNRTNLECLKALFGKESTKTWIGHHVTLGTEPTKTGLGIRVVGSPDINRDVIAEWTVARQGKKTKKMIPTGERRPQQQAQPPADPELVAFRNAVIAATKRTENPWTTAQITVALNAAGYDSAARVPAEKREQFLALVADAPPAAVTSEPTPTPDTEAP